MNENNQPENQAPSKEQIISFLKEQIEVKELQSHLQQLNTDIAKNRADEMEAYAKLAHYSSTPKNGDVIEHKVTQEDLDNNPEMTEQNIKVGDVIGIPKEDYEAFKSRIEKPSPLSVVE